MFYTTLFPSFYRLHLLACIYKHSWKPCILRSAGFSEDSWSCSTLLQNRIYQKLNMEKGLQIQAEKWKVLYR